MAGPKKSAKKSLKKLYFPLGRNIFGDVVSVNGVSYLKLAVFKSSPSVKGGRQRAVANSTFHLSQEEYRRLCLIQDRIFKQFSQLYSRPQLSKLRVNGSGVRQENTLTEVDKVSKVAPWWTQRETKDNSDDGGESTYPDTETYTPQPRPEKVGEDQNYYPTPRFYSPQATPTYSSTS